VKEALRENIITVLCNLVAGKKALTQGAQKIPYCSTTYRLVMMIIITIVFLNFYGSQFGEIFFLN